MLDLTSHVCAISKQVAQGAGVDKVEAPVGDDLKVEVRVFARTSKERFEQARVSAETAAKIREMLEAGIRKLAQGK